MLRLVHPNDGGNLPSRRRGVPAPALSLTADEARAVRAAARNIARTQYGTLRKLAAALGVAPTSLTSKRGVGPAMAVALARVSKMSVDAVLGWKALAAVPVPSTPRPRHHGPAGSEGWAE